MQVFGVDFINTKLPFTSIEVCRAFSQAWNHHLYHNQIHRKSPKTFSSTTLSFEPIWCPTRKKNRVHLKIFDSWASQTWQGLDAIGNIWDTWSSLKRILGPANTTSFFFRSLQHKEPSNFLAATCVTKWIFSGRKTSKEVSFPSLFSTAKGPGLMPRWYVLLQSSHRKMVVWVWWTYVLKTCQYCQLFLKRNLDLMVVGKRKQMIWINHVRKCPGILC